MAAVLRMLVFLLVAGVLSCNSIPAQVADGQQGHRGPTRLNPASPSLNRAAPPQFSHAAGFYTSNLFVAISGSGRDSVVRYSLDGSEPTMSSPQCSGPIRIMDRTTEANVLSMIPTVAGYHGPSERVFKGTVVRARTFEPGREPSEIVTRSYFVHPKGRGRYTVPVVSLATARDNFFDPEIGIYVPGNAPSGNFLQKGAAWERPVHVEFIETNGVVAFSQDGDVKIHGNSSPQFPIKGLDLDGTGGAGHGPFRHQIFPNRARTEFEHFLLRPAGHDHHLAFMRDELMQSLAEEFGAETQAARLAVVFLNGEYWGLHYLKEKEDLEFLSWYSKLPPGQIDYLEEYVVVKAGSRRHYDRMLEFIRAHSLATPSHYEHVRGLIDIPNFIDYKAAEIFNYRWDIGNHRLWRPQVPEGRWRWLQFDNDVGWGGFWAVEPAWSFDMLEAVLTPSGSLYSHNDQVRTFLFRRLLQSERFKTQFLNRLAILLNTIYHPAHTLARIDRFAAALRPEMREHIARWQTPPSMEQWARNVQKLREFAQRRPEAVRGHAIRKFGLEGTAVLTLELTGLEQATIQIDSSPIPLRNGRPWRGVYFKNLPLTLSAIAPPGFRFKEWQNAPVPATDPATVVLTEDTTIRVVFGAEN